MYPFFVVQSFYALQDAKLERCSPHIFLKSFICILAFLGKAKVRPDEVHLQQEKRRIG